MKKVLLFLELILFIFLGLALIFTQEQPTDLIEPTAPPTPIITPSPTPAVSALIPPVNSEPPRQNLPKPDPLKLYQNKNYREALNICLEEIKKNPTNRELYIIAGQSYLALGYYQEAFEIAKRGLEKIGIETRLSAISEEALIKIASQLLNENKQNEALNKIQTLITMAPTSARLSQAYALMGEIYSKRGNYIYADICYSYALYKNPGEFSWWLTVAQARERSGDYQGALKAYLAALGINGESEEAKRGRDRMRQKISL